MSNMILKGNFETQAMMCFDDGKGRTFYVRFYAKELEEEMMFIKDFYAKRPEMGLEITKVDKFYKIHAEGMMSSTNTGPWEILMHKYWALSNTYIKEKKSGIKYCFVRFSDKEIYEDEPVKIAV